MTSERKEESAQSCAYLGGESSRERSSLEETIKRFSSLKKKTYDFTLFLHRSLQNVINYHNKKRAKCHILASKYLEQIENCGEHIFVREYLGGIHRTIRSFTCKKSLWCLGCALRRSARFVQTYLGKVTYLLEQDPDLVPVLITITVKDGPDLEERYNHLKKVIRSIVNRRRKALNPSDRTVNHSPFRYILGGVGSYEFKRGANSEDWHPHIHMIALMNRKDFVFTEELVKVRKRKGDTEQKYKRVYVPKEFVALLAEELWKVSGDSFICDVRGLYPRDKYSQLLPLSAEDLAKPVYTVKDADGAETQNTPDSIFSGLCEAFKYSIKPDELSHEDWLEAATILQGKRLYFSFGNLYGVKVEIPETDADQLEEYLKALPYIERVYRYFHRFGEYKEIAAHPKGSEGEMFPDMPGKISGQAARQKLLERKQFIRGSTTNTSEIIAHVARWLEEKEKIPPAPF